MKVSIITPSYNHGEYIEHTLESVAMQRKNVIIEHMVIDGGSTDNTIKVLKSFSPPVRWISEKDNGQADAVNKGILSTNGEIIGWLNSDDIYYPGTVETIVKYFEANPEIDLVYGMADHIDQENKAFESYPTEPWNFKRLQEICYICQPALFFRRRVVEKYGLLDETLNFCMDYEYWLRLGMAGAKFGYLKKKLAGSRLYFENKTLSCRIEVHKEINDVFINLFGKVPDRWLCNYAHAVVERKVDRRKRPLFFMLRLLSSTANAAWAWNGKISKSMKRTFIQWSWGTILKH